jgi:glyoxylate carboligase
MAATYGRLTGRVGVCLATLGPGATNFATSAAYAQLGGMPMMMITGQKPIKKSKQGRFQIIDIVRMMRPMTKYTKQVVNGNNIPSMVILMRKGGMPLLRITPPSHHSCLIPNRQLPLILKYQTIVFPSR